jgi:hypothetical protein
MATALTAFLTAARPAASRVAAATRAAAPLLTARARALSAAAAAPPPPPPSSTPVPVALVKQLREMTGAPMMDCKNALAAEGCDMTRAVDWLRKKGLAAAGKKAGRSAAQGLVAAAVGEAGDVGVLVEVRAG